MTQEILSSTTTIHGFDSFQGIPESWGDEPAGTYSTQGNLPDVPANVKLHVGLFGDTVGKFVESQPGLPLAFANIDCDLYSSTADVLTAVQARVVPGTILLFDEYIAHETWRQDEFRAFQEACERYGWTYEYLGFSLGSKQAIVKIKEVRARERE